MESAATGAAPLPIGTRLLHIGPPKTGTTSLQGACWNARRELRRQGVRYAGPVRHAANAGRAAAGLGRSDAAPVPAWFWGGIVREVRRASEPRVLFSSEYLAGAGEAGIRRIAEDLDPDRIHVLVTLRPIARMLTSLWQQRVATGNVDSLDAWLELTLGAAGANPSKGMWHAHRHHDLVRRWVDVLGADQVTVLILDPVDHGKLLRDLEGLLALRPGTLQMDPAFVNRSLTLPEVDVLRTFNEHLRRAGVRRATIQELVREWISPYLETRTPPPDEPRIRLPESAQARIAPLAREIADGIRASGATVLGDLDSLLLPAVTVPDDERVTPVIPAELAATLAMGVAYAAGMLSGSRPGSSHQHLTDARELHYLSGRDLATIPIARARRLGPLWLRYRLGLGAP
jgi:hypothetical protein